MRFRSQQSPRSDATTMNSLVSPPRNRLSQTMSSQDPRSTLSRRFTTDSGRVPTLSSSAAPRGQDPSEYQVSCRGRRPCGGVSVWLRACLRFSKTQCAPGAWPSPPSPVLPFLPYEPPANLAPDADYATSSVGACALVCEPAPELDTPRNILAPRAGHCSSRSARPSGTTACWTTSADFAADRKEAYGV